MWLLCCCLEQTWGLPRLGGGHTFHGWGSPCGCFVVAWSRRGVYRGLGDKPSHGWEVLPVTASLLLGAGMGYTAAWGGTPPHGWGSCLWLLRCCLEQTWGISRPGGGHASSWVGGPPCGCFVVVYTAACGAHLPMGGGSSMWLSRCCLEQAWAHAHTHAHQHAATDSRRLVSELVGRLAAVAW